jgi:translation initiation factor IF-3
MLSFVSDTLWGGATGSIVKEFAVNEKIRAKEVLLVGEDGEKRGVVPLFQALTIAREKGLDLVAVSLQAVPPVCRLQDYGKYKYEQRKKEKEVGKAQRTGLREVRLRPKIDDHDLEFKVRVAEKLLKEGNKVKVTVRFRGREVTRPELGEIVLQRLTGFLGDIATADKPHMMGKLMSMVFSPSPGAKNAKDKDS